MTYPTPNAAYKAFLTAARAKAATAGGTANQWQDLFLLHLFVAQIFACDPDRWILKGGQALLMRNPGARYSKDIDVYRTGEVSQDEAIDALLRVAAESRDDLVRFTYRSRKDRGDDSRVAKLAFSAFFGAIEHQTPLNIDLITSPPPLGPPDLRPLEPALPLEWPSGWPTVALYPLVDHIADKICAMYEIQRNGQRSSRVRDLIDLVLIAQQSEPIDGRQLHIIVDTQVAIRRQRGMTLNLPPAFELPNEAWIAQYPKVAATVVGLGDHNTIELAGPLMSRFLDPILRREHVGIWNPREQHWRDTSEPETSL